jgi:drug/metabolite transporter (DMT)-like permease
MLYIILAMVLYGIAILFAAASSRNANTNLVAAIVNTVSAIIPIIAVIPILSKKTIIEGKTGIIYALIAGTLIAFFVMAINKAYDVNKVGVVAPVVFGGAMFISTIASYFVFKEKISSVQAGGLILLGLGLATIIYARATGK